MAAADMLCHLPACCPPPHPTPPQAVSLLETALELRRQVFSAGSYLYADTASALAAALLKQHKAAADATPSSSSGTGGGGWLRGRGKAAAAPGGVLRAIELYQAAIDIVVDAGAAQIKRRALASGNTRF